MIKKNDKIYIDGVHRPLEITAIYQDETIHVGRRLYLGRKRVDPKTVAITFGCIDKPNKICVGDKIKIPGFSNAYVVKGIFDDGTLYIQPEWVETSRKAVSDWDWNPIRWDPVNSVEIVNHQN